MWIEREETEERVDAVTVAAIVVEISGEVKLGCGVGAYPLN